MSLTQKAVFVRYFLPKMHSRPFLATVMEQKLMTTLKCIFWTQCAEIYEIDQFVFVFEIILIHQRF